MVMIRRTTWAMKKLAAFFVERSIRQLISLLGEKDMAEIDEHVISAIDEKEENFAHNVSNIKIKDFLQEKNLGTFYRTLKVWTRFSETRIFH